VTALSPPTRARNPNPSTVQSKATPRRWVHRAHRPDRRDRGQGHRHPGGQQRADYDRAQHAHQALRGGHAGTGAQGTQHLQIVTPGADQASDGLGGDQQRGEGSDHGERGQRDPVRLDRTLRLRLVERGDMEPRRACAPEPPVDLTFHRRHIPGPMSELEPIPADAAARVGGQQDPGERGSEQYVCLGAVDVVLDHRVVELDQANNPGLDPVHRADPWGPKLGG
jgi:hypothetical protein